MGLIAYPVKGKKKSEVICKAFIDGAPKSAEGVVFYGVNDTNMREWEKAWRGVAPIYYIDNSYFDSVRGVQFRVTKNDLQINAMEQPLSDGKRFGALGLTIKPLTNNVGGHWVLIEQSPSFMRDLANQPHWFDETRAWAESTGRRVVIRPWTNDKLKAQATLVADLHGAWGLLTHSSAAAVTAQLEGVPAIAERGCAVARVRMSADNSLDERRRALSVLADHQWTLDEMREGLAWPVVSR